MSGKRRRAGGIDPQRQVGKGIPREVRGKYGCYRCISELGGGANGTVYLAEKISAPGETLKERKYAIKFLKFDRNNRKERAKRIRRFEKEVQAVLQLQNEIPHIVPICDTPCEDKGQGSYWYVMPLAETYKSEQYSIEEKLRQMYELGKCLCMLHEKGFAHRDIKPGNLLLYGNQVCLSDFGLIWNSEEIENNLTEIGDRLGPQVNRPPEMRRIANGKDIDYRLSDVYLFAKTVWIILNNNGAGFDGTYYRNIPEICLDKKRLGVKTAEPLHRMLEGATRYHFWERIPMEDCIKALEKQISVVSGEIDPEELIHLQYEEKAKGVAEKIPEDAKIYCEQGKMLEILGELSDTAMLTFGETGKVYATFMLRSAKHFMGEKCELEVSKSYPGKKRSIIIAVKRLTKGKDFVWEMETGLLSDLPEDIPVYPKLKEALDSQEQQIGISGEYSIKISGRNQPLC